MKLSDMSTNAEVKQYQYEIQTYQEDCVKNIVSLFQSLRQKEKFSDVLIEHHKRQNYTFPVKDTKNIDVIMETGTGKTFSFIKTIFELSRNFGYQKFIILILLNCTQN